MTSPTPTLRTVFVGGPGRSGTSFVADRLAGLDQIIAFSNVELKFFSEKNGLLDLWNSLGEHYSPNRAVVALQQFRRFTRALIDGQFGQQRLAGIAAAEQWHSIFDEFAARLLTNGHPAPISAARFDSAARSLLAGVQGIAMAQSETPVDVEIFLEKTPHALLAMPFLNRIAPGSAYLHVMRDPRSIAKSLRTMPWGPDDLEQCCAWVDSYCQAWADSFAAKGRIGLDLQCLHIEDVAAAPDAAGRMIGGWLNLAKAEPVFTRADLATLNGWTARCDADDLALMSRRLEVWIDHFGYDRSTVGHRPAGSSGKCLTPEPQAIERMEDAFAGSAEPA